MEPEKRDKMFRRLAAGWRARDLKQTEVERRLGLPPNRVAKWKGGQGHPDPAELAALASLAGVGLDWLLDDDAPDEPPAASPVMPALSDLDWAVLKVARHIGHTTALVRLAEHPADPAPAVTPLPIPRPPRGVPSRPIEPQPTRRRRKGSA